MNLSKNSSERDKSHEVAILHLHYWEDQIWARYNDDKEAGRLKYYKLAAYSFIHLFYLSTTSTQ